MDKLAFCLVSWLLFFTPAKCEYEEEMWDRFRLWFHAMDHNYDNILSLQDVENCTQKHANEATQLMTVRAKCEEILPRWFNSFVLRGQDAVTENQFIQTFRDLRDDDVDKFENVIYLAAKLFWIIMDMNNDRWITEDEDACVGERRYNAKLLAISFAHYLLIGRPEEDIQDIFCPWIY